MNIAQPNTAIAVDGKPYLLIDEMEQTEKEVMQEIECAKKYCTEEEVAFLEEMMCSPSDREAILLKFVKESQEKRTAVTDSGTTPSGTEDDVGNSTIGKEETDGTTGIQGISNLSMVETKEKFKNFFPTVVKYAFDRWGMEGWKIEIGYTLESNSGEEEEKMTVVSGTDETRVIVWANSIADSEKKLTDLLVEKLGKRERFLFTPEDFTLSQANMKFGKGIGDLEGLREFCKNKLHPINDVDASLVRPNLNYVQYNGNDGEAFQPDMNAQTDKSYAVVVAGESGSGKSVLSCLLAKKYDYLPVYLLLAAKPKKEEDCDGAQSQKARIDVDVSQAFNSKPELEFPLLHGMLRTQLQHYPDTNSHTDSAVTTLCDIKAKLNVSRNRWAQEVLTTALASFKINDNARNWIEGSWTYDYRPDKVAIILDEATDIDLVEGLIETVKDVTTDLKKRLAKERLLLVLTGTGLDAIRYPGRIGTNPDYAKLIKVEGPANLDTLKDKLQSEVLEAAASGLFSKVMMTNTRMLFRSVIPILQSEIFHVDGNFVEKGAKKQRLEKRLTDIASLGRVMDHGPRFYVTQNSVGDLDGGARDSLLKDAFMYHLIGAVEAVKDRSENQSSVRTFADSYLQDAKGIREEITCKDKSMDIFSRGIATRFGTSRALKYLSCFGLTCELRIGWGDEFEELTALHYMRLMQVQGYEVHRATLKYSWPPKSNKGSDKITEKEIVKLKKKLDQQKREEFSFKVDQDIEKVCIVFSQGTPSAQGADVLALRKTGEVFVLEAIQCKHTSASAGQEVMKKWWSSLGIAYKASDSSWDWAPTEGSAGYSYTGLNSFRELLEERLKEPVIFGDRIMAMSFSMSQPTDIHEPAESSGPNSRRAKLWFKEMFEPTISVFPPSEGKTDRSLDSHMNFD
mmetsp:Transcript_32278/g.78752  ORF Transcript_32278/g.78752 Transcript_32278/m.78752 type:complete len:908 (-) Transcript_32278:358-3081(-)